MTPDYDPCLPAWRGDPYPHYRELRDHAPVYWAPATRAWCVSRYEDVLFVLRSPELFSSRAMFTYLMNQGHEGRPPFSWPMLRFLVRFVWKARLNPFEFATARNLIAEDGDRHTALRAIVNRGFTPRRIAAWEARAREIVAESMAKLRSGAAFDLVEDLAIPLPVNVIAEMLGVETSRRQDFKRWSDAIVENATGASRADPFNARFVTTILELIPYMRRIAEQRRRAPTDDLVSTIVAQQDGAQALTIREVIQFAMLLLVAGNETTTNLIGNAVTALLDHPDQLARVARDPSLVPVAIEETLRYDAPVQILFRTATQDVEIAGTRIPKGAYVAPILGSANRDERRFRDPDRFDLTRDSQGHLGFGFGKHFCLGASLARLEARCALEALVPELPRLERDRPRELVDSFLVRGPRRLALRRAA
ncbi:MAG TPA: cytochrome P450 [Myxococcota bacterium]|nr:cytochrome P450 [Myxococcota bacterium]